MKWEYAGHYAWFHVTQKHGLEWEDEGVWLIRIGDKFYRLVEGVNWLGRNGWELVGLHQINRFYGGEFLHYRTWSISTFSRGHYPQTPRNMNLIPGTKAASNNQPPTTTPRGHTLACRPGAGMLHIMVMCRR